VTDVQTARAERNLPEPGSGAYLEALAELVERRSVGRARAEELFERHRAALDRRAAVVAVALNGEERELLLGKLEGDGSEVAADVRRMLARALAVAAAAPRRAGQPPTGAVFPA